MISDHAWLIPALPAASALVIMLFGRRMARGGAEVGIAAIGVAFVLAVLVAVEVFSANVSAVAEVEAAHTEEHALAGEQVASTGSLDALALTEAGEGDETAIPDGVEAFVNERAVTLTPLGDGFDIEAGIRVDGLAAMMFLLVTFVSLMVQVYSTGYMHGDPRITYFFTLLSVFTFSMLFLVIGNNLFMVLVGWELVGVCSYLLIGFWWEERDNSNAAIKAFLTTKLGDVGLMVGVVTMWAMFGTFNIGEIITAVREGVQAGARRSTPGCSRSR